MEQFDTEIQTPVEHFVYRTPRIEKVVMHTRQSELVANVHDLFVLAGDWDLEIIQPMNTSPRSFVHLGTGGRHGCRITVSSTAS